MICPDVMQSTVPVTPRIPIIRAAPEPFPVPNSIVQNALSLLTAINGSQILSTKNPPRNSPMGMVKNCRVFLHAYTLPWSSIGITFRIITFWLAAMSGTNTQPMIWPMHHKTGLLENASKKFSIPSAKSIVR